MPVSILSSWLDLVVSQRYTDLGEAICVGANDGNVAFARRAAVLGRVLLDVEEEGFVLGDCCCARVFAYV